MYRAVRINRNAKNEVTSVTELYRGNYVPDLIAKLTTDRGLKNTFIEVPGSTWITVEPFGVDNRPAEIWITETINQPAPTKQ